MYGQQWIREIVRKNNASVDDRSISLMNNYVSLLLEWNKKINLISRQDEENIWNRHILGSIAFTFRFDLMPGARLVDVGTGGGLPGIPLAIVRSDLSILLLDSIQKKIRAVDDIVTRLGISNVATVAGRAEELSKQPSFSQCFDYVVGRAVAPIHNLIRWTQPFLRPRGDSEKPGSESNRTPISPGTLVLLKGGNLDAEIAEARLKLKIDSIETYPIIVDGIDPNDLPDKRLVIVRP